MSGGDRMDPGTQVPAIRLAWAPVATSCCVGHLMSMFPEVLTLVRPTWYRKPQGEATSSPRVSQTCGKRRNGVTGGEMLFDHDYRDVGVC
jgi:hypothetical protein